METACYLRDGLYPLDLPVGMAIAISAIESDTMSEKPPTMVQFAKAACGPPVYIAQPKSTGMPLTKFMVVYEAQSQLHSRPHERYRAVDVRMLQPNFRIWCDIALSNGAMTWM